MSGALERMVARTRGVLPGVQPLAAPVHVGLRPGPLETRETADPDGQPVGGSAARQDGETARQEIEPARRVRGPALPDEAGPTRREESPRRTEFSTKNIPESTISVEIDPATIHGTTDRERGTGRAERLQGPAAEMDREDPRSHPVGRIPSLRTEEETRGAPQTRITAEEFDRTWPVEESPRLRTRPLAEGTPDRAGSKPVPGSGAEAAPPQRTEIHVSIGNIELRAARPEPRHVAPAFRPRVSLDDFLGRKGGGR